MSRIQKLSFRDYLNQSYKVMMETEFFRPAPLLEKLVLSFEDKSSVHALPEHILSGHAPRLRILELRDCTPAWASPLLHGLTVLRVAFFYHVERPSMGQVLTALQDFTTYGLSFSTA
jgi:hypothetical protein